MKAPRVATIASAAGAAAAYLLVGPWPCARMEASRCGLVAYHYGSDVTLFPYQAVVTMMILGVAFGAVAWHWVDRERSPLSVRFLSGAVLFSIAAFSIIGMGGWIGLGAPFVVPFLWLAARHSSGWVLGLWTSLGGLSAAAGSWVVALALDIQWTRWLTITCGVGTTAIFLLTPRPRQTRLSQVLGDLPR